MDADWFLFVWMDITGSDKPWMDKSEAVEMKPATIHTAATVIMETQTYLVLASSVGEEGEIGNVNVVPRACVLHQVPIALH